jgi:hypothetical protein
MGVSEERVEDTERSEDVRNVLRASDQRPKAAWE